MLSCFTALEQDLLYLRVWECSTIVYITGVFRRSGLARGTNFLMYCSTLDFLCILEERLESSPLSQLGWLVKR